MTEQIKNLFKVCFKSFHPSLEERGIFLLDTECYKSKLVLNPQNIAISNSRDVYDKVKPFLRCLASKHIAAKHERYTYIESSFNIGIMVMDE